METRNKRKAEDEPDDPRIDKPDSPRGIKRDSPHEESSPSKRQELNEIIEGWTRKRDIERFQTYPEH